MFYQNSNKNLELASLKRDLEMSSRSIQNGRIKKRRRKRTTTRKTNKEVSALTKPTH